MEIQYVHDESGKRICVILPIELWNKIRPQVMETKKVKTFNPSEYRGIYKNLKVNLENEVKKLRQEWIRV